MSQSSFSDISPAEPEFATGSDATATLPRDTEDNVSPQTRRLLSRSKLPGLKASSVTSGWSIDSDNSIHGGEESLIDLSDLEGLELRFKNV